MSLFAVFVVAKAGVLAGAAPGSEIWLLASLWQDACVALAFALVERLLDKRLVAIVYYLAVAYAALNVPIARVTSSPLTMQMLHATGSALSDSILHYLTFANVGLMLGTIGLGIALPQFIRADKLGFRIAWPIFLLLAVAGAIADRQTTGRGCERNALATLVTSAFPRVAARSTTADWRASAFEYAGDPDLSALRGAARGRNVVIIGLESTGAEALKLYGSGCDPMPHLTALAKEALIFNTAYAVYPESIKGLFSVLCSRYPAFDTQPTHYARVTTPSIAEVLRARGYRTALFHSGPFMYLGMRSIIDDRGFDILEDAGHIGGNHNSSFGIEEPATVARMLEWTASLRSDERFFLFYLPIAGHHPYEAPDAGIFSGKDERSRYLNALHYSDAAVAEFLRGLKQQGHHTNTLFVIYGDHGEAFGQHEGNFGHTFFLYDENVRVPLIIAAPGLVEAQIRIENPASLIDIGPSIGAFLGLSCSLWQGVSLLDSRPRTALFFTDYSRPLVGLRDGPHKFICEVSGRGAQLFNMAHDAGETRLASAPAPLVAEWRQRATAWAAAQKALLRP